MTASAQGFDASSYQFPVTAAQLEGYTFAFCKATNGPSSVDPNFTANWRAIGESRVHRGAYHELEAGSAQAQAEHFLATVKAAGVKSGDMAACVASDYSGVTDAEVAGFCAAVAAGLGGSCPVLVYTSLSVAVNLTSCTRYPLWIAHPDTVAPGSVWPWDRWTIWQSSFGGAKDGGDRDAFNGTAAEMDAWIATYLPKPKKTGDTTMYVDHEFTEGVTCQASFPAGNVKAIEVVSGSDTNGEVAYRWRHAKGWYPALGTAPLTEPLPAGSIAGLCTTPPENMNDVDAVQVTVTGAAVASMHSIDG